MANMIKIDVADEEQPSYGIFLRRRKVYRDDGARLLANVGYAARPLRSYFTNPEDPYWSLHEIFMLPRLPAQEMHIIADRMRYAVKVLDTFLSVQTCM